MVCSNLLLKPAHLDLPHQTTPCNLSTRLWRTQLKITIRQGSIWYNIYLYLSNIQTAFGCKAQYSWWTDLIRGAHVKNNLPTLCSKLGFASSVSNKVNSCWCVSKTSVRFPVNCLYSSDVNLQQSIYTENVQLAFIIFIYKIIILKYCWNENLRILFAGQ